MRTSDGRTRMSIFATSSSMTAPRGFGSGVGGGAGFEGAAGTAPPGGAPPGAGPRAPATGAGGGRPAGALTSARTGAFVDSGGKQISSLQQLHLTSAPTFRGSTASAASLNGMRISILSNQTSSASPSGSLGSFQDVGGERTGFAYVTPAAGYGVTLKVLASA